MSLIPTIPLYPRLFSWDPWSDTPSRIFGQMFGSDLSDLIQDDSGLLSRADKGLSEIKVDADQFQVNLDCHHFKPEELNVKLLDNKIVVSGKHEEKQDEHGFIKREFTRTYMLPQGCLMDKMKSSFTNQGMLSIQCPRKVDKKDAAKAIPIERIPGKNPQLKSN